MPCCWHRHRPMLNRPMPNRLLPSRGPPGRTPPGTPPGGRRSEEHTSELQSLMRISYAVFCLKKKKQTSNIINHVYHDDLARTSYKQKRNTTETPQRQRLKNI